MKRSAQHRSEIRGVDVGWLSPIVVIFDFSPFLREISLVRSSFVQFWSSYYIDRSEMPSLLLKLSVHIDAMDTGSKANIAASSERKQPCKPPNANDTDQLHLGELGEHLEKKKKPVRGTASPLSRMNNLVGSQLTTGSKADTRRHNSQPANFFPRMEFYALNSTAQPRIRGPGLSAGRGGGGDHVVSAEKAATGALLFYPWPTCQEEGLLEPRKDESSMVASRCSEEEVLGNLLCLPCQTTPTSPS
ncbi:hypothetical protein L249_0476 [Ophiocordyceps polyrhachis-furcata BCC 54312]|uniref:Uncharacterized protein n=1 Tax=Ophiocordyceps polyrhachis-furcata BCC 54312 TaxID=1330021 RepID=A0A367LD67_9HYPO|nr:hypothetical protein L249_0476 [Ophiocordyceps polyrhachis-furcata BCC 54312]